MFKSILKWPGAIARAGLALTCLVTTATAAAPPAALRAPGVELMRGMQPAYAASAIPSTPAQTTDTAQETSKKDREVIKVKFSTVIPAGTFWNSPTRFDESCTFDLAVDFDETITIVTGPDRETWRVRIHDVYTNLQTGNSFVDTGNFTIRVDRDTNIARFNGIQWLVFGPDGGIEVLDVGPFKQDWDEPIPRTNFDLRGVHEVNSLPFGTLSYCDWAIGIFP